VPRLCNSARDSRPSEMPSRDVMEDTLSRVRSSAAKKILFLPHAVKQMSQHDRMIGRLEVHRVIESGVIIEDYPNDPRGGKLSCVWRL
jgi:hypothetical protein